MLRIAKVVLMTQTKEKEAYFCFVLALCCSPGSLTPTRRRCYLRATSPTPVERSEKSRARVLPRGKFSRWTWSMSGKRTASTTTSVRGGAWRFDSGFVFVQMFHISHRFKSSRRDFRSTLLFICSVYIITFFFCKNQPSHHCTLISPEKHFLFPFWAFFVSDHEIHSHFFSWITHMNACDWLKQSICYRRHSDCWYSQTITRLKLVINL